MNLDVPRARKAAVALFYAVGAFVGLIWLLTVVTALFGSSDPAGRGMSAGIAGFMTLVMLVFVIPAARHLWRGGNPFYALSLGGVLVLVLVLLGALT